MSQLFVGRLPRDTQSSELERIFEKYGKMSRCDVKRGVNSCYGFVEFAEACDAEDAIKQCNGMSVQGERIVVEMATGSAKRRNDSSCFRCGTEGKSRSRNRDGRDGRDSRDNRDNRDNRDGRDNRHRGDRRDYRSRRHNGDSPHRRARSPRRHDSGRSTRRHSRSRSRSPAHGRRRDRSRTRRSPSPERRRGNQYEKPEEKPFAAEEMAV
ncbi:hypothetical protein GGH96_002707 [Coemansia sp. RSA 1972]|nr:hypothetical protein GGH96_002707 [Coemansia sp. RSA 1972]